MTSLPLDLFTVTTAVHPNISFRLVQEEDRRPLHRTCYSDYNALKFRDLFNHLLRRQEQEHCFWLVITADDNIIGNGQLVIYSTSAECANLFVIPEYRGQGIGTALIELLTAVARHLNITNLEIGVSIDNPRAQALYQRLGFQEDRRIQLPDSKPSIILHKVIT
jgi:RimJ/RimL family protein N-acetyltransferase